MGPKSITVIVLVVIALIAVGASFNALVGQVDDEQMAFVQFPNGSMVVKTIPGYYGKWFGKETMYPKMVRVYFSSDVREGSETDESCKVVFSDKGSAKFSSMVLYSTPYLIAGEAIVDGKKGLAEGPASAFHRLIRGDMDIADKTILSRIKEYARIQAGGINATECVENQATFISGIRTAVKGDATLKKYGIVIEELTLSDIVFDLKTLQQFEKQQDAILASKEAEAKKIEFEMKKLATEADFANKIAEVKGTAEMEMMTQTTDAERDAKLATIEAQKNVDVAVLAKKTAETKAAEKESVAKINKAAALVIASEGFEVAEIAANEALEEKKAMISLAEGKQKMIELSGAITQQEEVLAKIAAQRDVSISANIMKIAVPSTMFISGGGKGNGNGSGNGGNGDYFGNLLSYTIAQSAGLIPKASPQFVAPVAPVSK